MDVHGTKKAFVLLVEFEGEPLPKKTRLKKGHHGTIGLQVREQVPHCTMDFGLSVLGLPVKTGYPPNHLNLLPRWEGMNKSLLGLVQGPGMNEGKVQNTPL